jgi:hypothetical protein
LSRGDGSTQSQKGTNQIWGSTNTLWPGGLGNGYKGHNPEERLPVFAKEEEDLITEAAGSQFSESTESRSLCETLPPEPILVEFTPEQD